MSATQGDLGDTRGPGGNEPPAGFLAWWRRRAAARRANLEARHLLKEARRILKRRADQIPGAVAATVRSAVQAVVDAVQAGDVERMRKANVALDEVMDDHLAFARKSTLREYAESIGVAIAVALLLRAFITKTWPEAASNSAASGDCPLTGMSRTRCSVARSNSVTVLLRPLVT